MNQSLVRGGQKVANAVPATAQLQRFDCFWVYLLFFSFVYDRPVLSLFGFLRADPRPFDLVFVGFLLYVLSSRARLKRRFAVGWFMKRPLRLLIGWAAVVVVLQFIWIPSEYQRFSLFYLVRYLQLYATVWLVATSSLTDVQRQRALKVFLLTVVIVSVYGVLQYQGVIPTFQISRTGDVLELVGSDVAETGMRLTSTLGYHYAYFGGYSVLGVVLAFLLLVYGGVKKKRNALFLGAAMIAGLVGMILSQTLSAYGTLAIAGALVPLMSLQTSRGLRPRYVVVALLTVVAGFGVYRFASSTETARFGEMWQKTIDPSLSSANDVDDPTQRLSGTVGYIFDYFSDARPEEIFFGRGFYVSRGIGGERRIGYGIHNIFTFMLEQAGPVGFLLGLYLIWIFIAEPWRQIRKSKADRFAKICGNVIFAWAVALLLAGLSGQIFWIFESLGNWFTIVMCLWSLLIHPGESERWDLTAWTGPSWRPRAEDIPLRTSAGKGLGSTAG